MRYTRYDYKVKKSHSIKGIAIVLCVFFIAFLFGKGIFEIVTNNTSGEKQISQKENIDTSKTIKLIGIQAGVFKNRDNAEVFKNKLKQFVVPFTIVEGDNVKILCGIFTEEDSVKYIQGLEGNNIEYAKMYFEIAKSEICDVEIGEIVQAYLKIIEKLKESDVSSVQTEEFKKWMENLEAVSKDSQNYDVLEEIKKYINELPAEIQKEKIEESYVFIYNILRKVK